MVAFTHDRKSVVLKANVGWKGQIFKKKKQFKPFLSNFGNLFLQMILRYHDQIF